MNGIQTRSRLGTVFCRSREPEVDADATDSTNGGEAMNLTSYLIDDDLVDVRPSRDRREWTNQ